MYEFFAGKTFVAQELGQYFAQCKGGRKGRLCIVQFHPTYAYEDFIEGYRPITTATQGITKTAHQIYIMHAMNASIFHAVKPNSHILTCRKQHY
jgi:5-methylcytosine-specific restriction endonuclease McrBC GTP-binding regulatory subunit McrB